MRSPDSGHWREFEVQAGLRESNGLFAKGKQESSETHLPISLIVRDRKAKRFRYQGKGAANMLIVHNRPPDPLNGYQTH